MKTAQNFLFLIIFVPVAFAIFFAWLQVLHGFPLLTGAGLLSWIPAGVVTLVVLAGIWRILSGTSI